MGFKNFSLGDLCLVKSSKRIYAKDYVEVGVPFYRSKEIIQLSKGENISTDLFISPAKFNELNSKFGSPRIGDILITSVGTIGVPYLVDHENFYFKDGNLTWLSEFDERINNLYIYYWLTSRVGHNEIEKVTIGSTQKALTIVNLKSINIKVPPLKIQNKITGILSLIDNKLQINSEMIANLEELSQTLFKRWFIDFEFPDENGNPYKSSGGGMVNTFSRNIPENWDVLELKELLTNTKNNIKPGKYTKTHPYVPIDLIPMKKLNFYEYKDGCEAKSSLLKFDKNDILLGSMRVYFHRVSLAPYSGTTRSTVFVLKPKHEYLTYYLLHFINQKDFISFASNSSSGSTIPYAVWNDTLENYLTILPSKKVLDDFNNRVKNLFDISQNLLLENKNLIELRDSLLPKLMSGEIELPDELEVDEHAELLQ